MILETNNLKENLMEKLKLKTETIKDKGVHPCLAIIRVGESKADLSYERGLEKSASSIGLSIEKYIFSNDVVTEDIVECVEELNHKPSVGGILIFRPLPKKLDEERINQAIAPEKDVDCVTHYNQVNVFLGKEGKRPATAISALRILKSLEEDLSGKNVVIVNRSMVIGKPLALMLLKENATVTIAHSKTKNLQEITSRADILVTGIGKANYIDDSYVSEDSIVIDCGINFQDGVLSGDVYFDKVRDKVKYLTPVPGGVGALTNLCLLESVLETLMK